MTKTPNSNSINLSPDPFHNSAKLMNADIFNYSLDLIDTDIALLKKNSNKELTIDEISILNKKWVRYEEPSPILDKLENAFNQGDYKNGFLLIKQFLNEEVSLSRKDLWQLPGILLFWIIEPLLKSIQKGAPNTIWYLSQGRAETTTELLIWNLSYWPMYWKQYKTKPIKEFLINTLTYQRIIQLIIFSIGVPLLITKPFQLTLQSLNTSTKTVIFTGEFVSISRPENEQIEYLEYRSSRSTNDPEEPTKMIESFDYSFVDEFDLLKVQPTGSLTDIDKIEQTFYSFPTEKEDLEAESRIVKTKEMSIQVMNDLLLEEENLQKLIASEKIRTIQSELDDATKSDSEILKMSENLLEFQQQEKTQFNHVQPQSFYNKKYRDELNKRYYSPTRFEDIVNQNQIKKTKESLSGGPTSQIQTESIQIILGHHDIFTEPNEILSPIVENDSTQSKNDALKKILTKRPFKSSKKKKSEKIVLNNVSQDSELNPFSEDNFETIEPTEEDSEIEEIFKTVETTSEESEIEEISEAVETTNEESEIEEISEAVETTNEESEIEEISEAVETTDEESEMREITQSSWIRKKRKKVNYETLWGITNLLEDIPQEDTKFDPKVSKDNQINLSLWGKDYRRDLDIPTQTYIFLSFSVFLTVMSFIYHRHVIFIFREIRKDAETLYQEYRFIGRGPDKVQWHELTGLTGNPLLVYQMLNAFQVTRGAGIYSPTFLRTIGEQIGNQLVPATFDYWILQQKSQILKNFKQIPIFNYFSITKKIPFYEKEQPAYKWLLLNSEDKTTIKTKRFNFIKQIPKVLFSFLKSWVTVNQITHFVINKIGFDNFARGSIQSLQWIEKEVNNLPLFAAIQPRSLGMPVYPKGLLVVGASGSGRSLISNALATESRLRLFKSESNRFIHEEYGTIRLIEFFNRLRQESPCLGLINDLDFVARHRDQDDRIEVLRLTAQFLLCIDGYTVGCEPRVSVRPIFIIGTAESLNHIDPACLRSGRFEWVIYVENPNKRERQEFIQLYTQKRPLTVNSNVSWEYFSAITEGYTVNEIKALLNTSALYAIKNGQNEHTHESVNLSLNNLTRLKTQRHFIDKSIPQNSFLKQMDDVLAKKNLQTLASAVKKEGNNTYQIQNKQRFIYLKDVFVQKQNKLICKPKHRIEVTNKYVNWPQYALASGLLDCLIEGVFLGHLDHLHKNKNFTFFGTTLTQDTYCSSVTREIYKAFQNNQSLRTIEEFFNIGQGFSHQNTNWTDIVSTDLKSIEARALHMGAWYISKHPATSAQETFIDVDNDTYYLEYAEYYQQIDKFNFLGEAELFKEIKFRDGEDIQILVNNYISQNEKVERETLEKFKGFNANPLYIDYAIVSEEAYRAKYRPLTSVSEEILALLGDVKVN